MRKYLKDKLTTVFVISGQEERRLPLVSEFLKVGIFPIWIKAVYCKNELPRVGIMRAHKKCVNIAQMKKYPFVIIAEDDVRFSHVDSVNYFLESMKNLPADWDIFVSGFYEAEKFEQDFDNIWKVEKMCGFHFYAVSERYYERYLQADEKYNIDLWTTDMSEGKANTFCIIPFVAYQANGYSENAKREVNYDYLLKERIFYHGKQ